MHKPSVRSRSELSVHHWPTLSIWKLFTRSLPDSWSIYAHAQIVHVDSRYIVCKVSVLSRRELVESARGGVCTQSRRQCEHRPIGRFKALNRALFFFLRLWHPVANSPTFSKIPINPVTSRQALSYKRDPHLVRRYILHPGLGVPKCYARKPYQWIYQ